MDILRSPRMIYITSICFLLWGCCAISYYSTYYFTAELAGDFYTNFFIMSIIEVPVVGVGAVLMAKWGRRFTIFFFMSGTGIILGCAIPLNSIIESNLGFKIFYSLLAKFFASGGYVPVILYTPEVFPTNMRALGWGLSDEGARIGSFVAPFYNWARQRLWWGPQAGIAAICLLVTIGLIWLPETKGRQFATTVAEVESWGKDDKKSKTKT